MERLPLTVLPPSNRLARHGFTLVELLAVIAILLLMATLVVPAINGIRNASELTRAGLLVIGQIDVARQTAAARSHSIEVQFYSFKDPLIPQCNDDFRAMQLFEILPDGTKKALDKVQQLPASTKISSSETLSSLLRTGYLNDITPKPSIPRIGLVSNILRFQIHSNGLTNLPNPNLSSGGGGGVSAGISNNHFITIDSVVDTQDDRQLPKNYFTLQIDPLNATTRSYRP